MSEKDSTPEPSSRSPSPATSATSSASNTGVGRRSFLGSALGAGAVLGAAGVIPNPLSPGASAGRAARAPDLRPARNLIFMVSDGMSMGTLQLANLYSRLKQGRATRWVELLAEDRVTRSVIETSSANSHVTDSAAAACAWGLGEKIDNGRLGWTPDGRTPTPIAIQAKLAGKATGLVTTTRITHATPAGFCVNLPEGNRDHEDRIAVQMLERPVDVLLGGGGRFVDPVIEEHVGVFDVLRTRDELLAMDTSDHSRRVLGVFARSHMAFELDREETHEPSLAEMARVALARLDQHGDGFLLQIEGGRVDHAAHHNDAGALVTDQIAFDEALRVVLEYVDSRDDTLLVVTTDHGNANPGLTDYGSSGIEGFARVIEAHRSFDWIRRRIGEDLSPEHVRQVVHEATSVTLNDRDLGFYIQWRRTRQPVDPFWLAHHEDHGPLGSVLANHYKTAFLSPNHTADYVELTALGPGSTGFGGWMPIERVHRVLVEALDLPPAPGA